VGQVRQETEAELIAIKSQIEVVNSSFETKLAEANVQAQDSSDRVSSQITANRSEVKANINQLNQEVNLKLTRQGERLREIKLVVDQEKATTETRFDQISARIVALETNFSEVSSRAVVAAGPRSLSSNPPPLPS
jgi:hypothetical protein